MNGQSTKLKPRDRKMLLFFTAAELVKKSESRESDRPDLKHLFTDVGTAAHRGFGVTGCELP